MRTEHHWIYAVYFFKYALSVDNAAMAFARHQPKISNDVMQTL